MCIRDSMCLTLRRRSTCSPLCSSCITVVRELLDVLDHTIKLPLPVDFLLATQGKAIHLLVGPYIAKHRLNRGKAPRDHLASAFAVDLSLHAIARLFFGLGVLAYEDGRLPDLTALRMAQTLGS